MSLSQLILRYGPQVWSRFLVNQNPKVKHFIKSMVLKKRSLFWTELENQSIKHASQIQQPMILISQIQRSGGTLMSQLFDGHPECHVHPYEIKIGSPRKYDWPELKLSDSPEDWFCKLFEAPVIDLIHNGYKKGRYDETFPYLFHPSLQRKIFLREATKSEPINLRIIFDAYWTSYFGAWLNYRNTIGNKQFVVGFVARMNMNPSNMEQFFQIYPDGRLISIVRNPCDWYVSARAHDPTQYGSVEKAINLWKSSAEACLHNAKTHQGKVIILKFEDLVESNDEVMKRIAEIVGITYSHELTVPTFNGEQIPANTSFESDAQKGIITTTTDRKKALDKNEISYIESQTVELYNKLQHLCIT